jgi:methionine sulfoxide reductase heme-binding subunit
MNQTDGAKSESTGSCETINLTLIGIMAQVKLNRNRHRLFRHHLPLFALSTAAVACLYFTRPYPDILSRASFATAYPALALLAATLLMGPLNLIRKRPNPVSSDLRRDMGIWAGVLSILHVAVGQNVHMRGRPWLYYIYGPNEHKSFPIRHDLFGLANYTGAVSTLVLIALLATSNDYFLRTLGTPRWKQLQRWNYAAFGAAAIHAVAFQGVEKQKLPYVLVVMACIAITIAMQTAGILKRRSNAKARSLHLGPTLVATNRGDGTETR